MGAAATAVVATALVQEVKGFTFEAYKDDQKDQRKFGKRIETYSHEQTGKWDGIRGYLKWWDEFKEQKYHQFIGNDLFMKTSDKLKIKALFMVKLQEEEL